VKLHRPDWGDESRSLAVTVWSLDDRLMFHIMFNAYWEALEFEIPPGGKDPVSAWRRLLDTSLEAPEDISDGSDAKIIREKSYTVQPRSMVMLIARFPGRRKPDQQRRRG
jgi:glycogen operon protein